MDGLMDRQTDRQTDRQRVKQMLLTKNIDFVIKSKKIKKF